VGTGRLFSVETNSGVDRRDANSISPANRLERLGIEFLSRLNPVISAKRAILLLLPIAVAACASGEDTRQPIAMDYGSADQAYPGNHRTELLAFMRTYLNNPVGIHDASLADPVQRTVGGRLRYVSCVRYVPRESDGSYRELRERAILYVNGRLDRVVESAGEACAGAVYAPFPDLEKLTR
jgi:hypothetical protein